MTRKAARLAGAAPSLGRAGRARPPTCRDLAPAGGPAARRRHRRPPGTCRNWPSPGRPCRRRSLNASPTAKPSTSPCCAPGTGGVWPVG